MDKYGDLGLEAEPAAATTGKGISAMSEAQEAAERAAALRQALAAEGLGAVSSIMGLRKEMAAMAKEELRELQRGGWQEVAGA